LTLAQGAAAQAADYLMECLQIGLDSEPMPDELHQAFLTACMFTIVVLETTIKKNLPNPAARAKLRDVLDELSTRVDQLSRKKENPA
jgi:hypothetical protein